MTNVTVTVRMGVKCAECGRGGATDSGICLACVSKAMQHKPMKSPAGKIIQARILKSLSGMSRT